MKIKIDKSQVKTDTLSYSKTKKIVDILESSKYVENEVIKFRKKHNIPPNGYPLKLQEDFLIYSDKMGELFDKGLVKDCSRIASKLNIPLFWSSSIIDVLMGSMFFPPSKEGFKVISTSRIGSVSDPFEGDSWAIDENTIRDLFTQMVKEKAVVLTIRQKFTKTALKKLIDQNWDAIESGMQSLPEIKLHNVQRVKLSQQITQLRDQEGMKFSKIATTLATQYEDDLELYDLLNEDYVKNLYSRWKKKTKKVSAK